MNNKAIKFKDGIYLDSTGSVHKQELLSDVLDRLETSTGDINTEITEIKNDITTLENDKADKSDTYTKAEVDAEIDAKVSSVYKFAGSVADKAALDAIDTTEMVVGTVYDVQSTGMNYAWNGTDWDELGGNYDFSSFATKEELATAVEDLESSIEDLETSVEGLETSLEDLETKIGEDFQEKLVSGTNIKTVNGESLLGSGDVEFNNIIELSYEEVDSWTEAS